MERTNLSSADLTREVERYKRELMDIYARAPRTPESQQTLPPAAEQNIRPVPMPMEHMSRTEIDNLLADTPEAAKSSQPQMPTTSKIPSPQVTAPPEREMPAPAQDISEGAEQPREIFKNGDGYSSAIECEEIGSNPDALRQLEEYSIKNPKRATIQAQTLTARRTIPVKGAKVSICKRLEDGKYKIAEGTTDESGQTEDIEVPAIDKQYSEQPGPEQAYSFYDITVTHPEFTDIVITEVPVFEGIRSIQTVDMVPKAAAPDGTEYIQYQISEHSNL